MTTATKKIQPGYKQTEVGVIPEDWEVKYLGDIADLLTGHPFPSSKYTFEGIRLLRGSNIKRGNTDWSSDITMYWTEVTGELQKYILQVGDVVIAMDGSLVGKSFAQLSEQDLPALLLQRVTRIRSNHVDINYLKHQIVNPSFTRYLDSVKTASAIPHISPTDIREYQIPLPSKSEQTAIATALSDMDALIAAQEQLIAKKRAIKQGAMQELLEAKEGWEEKTMKTIGKTYGGLSGKSIGDFYDGGSLYIPFMNVFANPVIKTDYFDYVKIKQGESQNKALKGDLFFNTSSETPEEVGMCSVLNDDVQDLYLNSFCFGFRIHREVMVDGLYLSYYFRSSYGREKMFLLAQGATRYNLSKGNFLKLELQLPSYEEQTRIAQILSDIDAEIEQLGVELAKLRGVKKGMMEGLLTGAKRLNH